MDNLDIVNCFVYQYLKVVSSSAAVEFRKSITNPVVLASQSSLQCLIAASTKLLGYFIIVASSVIKLPQLLKIVTAQSASGLSFSGTLLELIAITFTAVYSFANKFPFRYIKLHLFFINQNLLIRFISFTILVHGVRLFFFTLRRL